MGPTFTIHTLRGEGPLVNGDQFAAVFEMDCTDLGGKRQTLREVAIYTVHGGAIVEERFFPLTAATAAMNA